MLKKNIKSILSGEQRWYYKLKDMWWEIQEAHRRFWRGYDNSMIWNMNTNLLELIKQLLIELRDNHTGYPYVTGEIESDEDYVEILDLMIFHIEETQRLELYYEPNWGKEQWQQNREMIEYHKSEFFRLFVRYYDGLWD